MGAFQLTGVPPEVMADPRVQEALAAVSRNPETEAAKALTSDITVTLEKYGVKARKISLTIVGPILVRMMELRPSFPSEYQMTAMLFVLCAPLRQIYAALEEGEKGGTAAFMGLAAEWIENAGIPQDMSEETTTAVMNTFKLAAKLIGKNDGEGGGEKKAQGHRGS